MGIQFYENGFAPAVQTVLGTPQNIQQTSIGVIAALLFAGTLFLCCGISVLSRAGSPDDHVYGDIAG